MKVAVTVDGKAVECKAEAAAGRVRITLGSDVTLKAGQTMEIRIE